MVPDDDLARTLAELPVPPSAAPARDALLEGDAGRALALLDADEAPAPVALHLRGLAHLARGDLYRAADTFAAVTAADPSLFDPLYRLGRIEALRDEHDRAVEHLRAALELRPDHPGAIAALADCHNARGEPGEAENVARRGLVFAPDSAELLTALGSSLRRQGRHADAAPVLARASNLADGDERIRVALGRTLLALGRPAEARPLFEEVLRRHTDQVGALAGMAEALEMEGRLEDAVGYVLRAVAAAPDRPALHVLLGRLNLRAGRFEAAENAASTASTLAPHDADALRIALRAALGQRRLRRAAGYADRLRGVRAGDPEALAAVSVVRLLDGRIDDARKLMGRAEDPAASPDAQRALGCVQLAAGRAQAAAGHFTEALRLRGHDALAQRLLELAWEAVAEPEIDAPARMRALWLGEASPGGGDDDPDGGPERRPPATGPIAPLVQAAVNRLLAESAPGVELEPPDLDADPDDGPRRVERTTTPRAAEPPVDADAPNPDSTAAETAVDAAPETAIDVSDDVLTRMHRLRHLLRAEPSLGDLLGQVTELIEGHDSPLLLAVFGPRGAGKTAFVNALIGEEVIPEDTALPHLVRYGRRAGGRVVHHDGRVEACGLTALRTALAERRLRPPDVRWVEILLPVEELVRASILDAPDPLDPTADDALVRRADAVLWLVGVDQAADRWAEAARWLADQPMAAIGVITRCDLGTREALERARAVASAALGARAAGLVAVSAQVGLRALRSRDVPGLRASGITRLHRLMQDAFFSRAGHIRRANTRARLADVVDRAEIRVAERLIAMDEQAAAVAALAERVERDRAAFSGPEEIRAGRALDAAIAEAIRHAATEVAALHRDHGGAFTPDQLVATLRDQLREALGAAVERVRGAVDGRLDGLIRGCFEAFDGIFPGPDQSAEAARVAGLQGILDGYRLLMLEETFGRHRAYLEGWVDQAPLGDLFEPGRALAVAGRGGLFDADALVVDLRRHGLRLDHARGPRLAGLGRPLFDGMAEFLEDTATELRLARIALVKRLEEPLARLGRGLGR